MKQKPGHLFDKKGNRNYLTQQERALIEKAAEKLPREIRGPAGALKIF